MWQMAAPVWNRIAAMGLRTEWARGLMHLPPDLMQTALEAEETRLARRLGDELTAAAFLEVAPLLWEREAVEAAVVAGAAPAGLVVPASVQEAVAMATREMPLSARQRERLAEALRNPA